MYPAKYLQYKQKYKYSPIGSFNFYSPAAATIWQKKWNLSSLKPHRGENFVAAKQTQHPNQINSANGFDYINR